MARTQTLTDGAQSFPSAQHARPDAGKSNPQHLQKGIRAKVATFAAMGKKVILRLLLVVLVSSLMPHGRAAAQLAYGLRGGVGFPTLRSTFVDRTNRTANIVGFHAGASIAYFFATAPGLYVESGAQLALLGGASLNVNWYNPSASDYNTRLQLYALQIPLRLGFTTPLGALSIYVSGGFLWPYGDSSSASSAAQNAAAISKLATTSSGSTWHYPSIPAWGSGAFHYSSGFTSTTGSSASSPRATRGTSAILGYR